MSSPSFQSYLETTRPQIHREGPNPGTLLALKLVLPLGQLEHPPSSFIVLDKARMHVERNVTYMMHVYMYYIFMET